MEENQTYYAINLQGVPKKGDPRLNGHKGHYKLTKDESMMSLKNSGNFLSNEYQNFPIL